jgi:outer membrane lipoprotein SlyB
MHSKENNAMENTSSRLHPLLTAAAISVTVFSAVGVGTLTGLVPHSIGSQKEVAPLQEVAPLPVPPEVAKPIEPAITHPASQPASKPVQKKPVVRSSPPRSVEPAVYREFAEAPRVAEAPKPVVQPGNVGTIQAVREVTQPGQHTGLGPIAGGIAGAVIGDQLGGKGNTRKVLTVLGAAGGAYAGREIEKQARSTKRWEIDVRHDSGMHETVLSDVAPPFAAGDRVRVVDGRLQPV